MSSLVRLITDQIIQTLEDACMNSLPANDPTRAGFVGRGPLEDPELTRISILVYPNDPDDRTWVHEVDKNRIHLGGPSAWIRRFCVVIHCYFTLSGETADVAEDLAHTVLHRVESALSRVTWNISDTRGETLIGNRPVVKSYMEPGGEGRQHYWTGKVWLEFTTTGG